MSQRLSQALKVLSGKIEPGMKASEVLNVQFLKAIQDAILGMASGDHLQVNGEGVSMTHSPGGIALHIPGGGGFGLGGAVERFPFEVTPAALPADARAGSGKKQYQVNFGTLNNLIPTGCATPIALSKGQFAGLEVHTDGRQVITAKVVALSSTEPPGCTKDFAPRRFTVPLALIDKAEIVQIWKTNLIAKIAMCAQTEKQKVAPGTSPWENWWTWMVASELNTFDNQIL